MSIVVDASIAVPWFLPVAGTEDAKRVLRSGESLIAPELIVAEIANAAWKAAVFQGVSSDLVKDIVRESSRFFAELVPLVDLKDRAFLIALELRHPIYDCFYLALADLRGLVLLTADERLLRRCSESRFHSLLEHL
jgi:predicted nucleic acid-binding protein